MGDMGTRQLSEEECNAFNRDGYLVLPGFWDASEVNAARESIANILTRSDLTESKTIFTTDEQQREATSNKYFIGSGDKIRFFWEADAFDEAGNFTQPDRSMCINKIGHGLHDLDEAFQRLSYDPRIGQMSRDLGVQRPQAVQSMYIFKQPKIGGKVGAHRDGTFIYTEPQSVIGFWWALEDCSLTNGCLWAVPGSHKRGVCRRFKRKADDSGLEFTAPEEDFDLEGAVSLPVKAGTLVLLHSAVVHYSLENKSDKSRHAYTLHVVDGKEGVTYPADNWLQREDGRPFNDM